MAENVAIDPKKLNIYQRMLKAQSMIETVQKKLEVEAGKTRSYKAVCESDVLDVVKKAEEACGIYSFPFQREIYENKETKNSYGTINFWMRFRVTYRFLNVDDPTDFIDITSYGDGVDTLDKAPGKGMTYADKYALMKAYKISTGEDLDNAGSENQSEVVNESSKPSKSIDDLIMEWSKYRSKLTELGIDYRDEAKAEWILNKAECSDQNVDMNDYDKMLRLNKVYRTLIKSKMDEESYKLWLNQ